MSLFKLKGYLSPRADLILTILGFGLTLLIWFILTAGANPMVSSGILPKPAHVLTAFGDLYRDNYLVKNICRSLGLNLSGYLEAILIAIPVGFVTGLYPFFRGSFQKQIDAFRFVPLTAVTGLFIIWFGLDTDMKVHFLAFGILIYLLPVVVQRIDEIEDVYFKTVYTLGANSWQIIRTVYFPAVMSRLSDDIRVLTAISWTYIIIAESLNNQGGIGALIWRVGMRQGRIDKVFALLIIIVVIGFLQDKVFTYLDREFFPHKYTGDAHGSANKKKSSLQLISTYFWNNLLWASLAGYIVLFINEWVVFLNSGRILSEMFGDTTWVIHALIFTIIGYKVRKVILTKKGSLNAKLKVDMKKTGIGLMVLLLLISSCEMAGISLHSSLEEEILLDGDFQVLVEESRQMGTMPAQEAIAILSHLEPTLMRLNERFIEGRPVEYWETFTRLFEDQLEIDGTNNRLAYRYFDTQYEIPADIDRIWEAITDVDAYPEWNPFTPVVETNFEVGGPIIMHVRLFPLFPDALLVQEETVVEYTINDITCWETELISPFFFRSHRCYEVEMISSDRTLLVNSMIYEGLLAPLVNSITKPLVLQGFHDMSQALIERLED